MPSKEEIKQAVFFFKPFKAPRPNGQHPYFYQKFQDIIQHSVLDFCYKTLLESKIDESINATHNYLIPKYSDAQSLKNYRPMSLCNTSYKIITKMISTLLRPIMEKIIGPCQTSFLKNRQAIDNAIIVQEIISKFRKTKEKIGNSIMKIDLEKAFDKLEWSFIRNTLIYFNFCSRIINLIMFYICTRSSAVLINGARTDFFNPSRGICQGDTISPLYFHYVYGGPFP